MSYRDFLSKKTRKDYSAGIEGDIRLNKKLFPFQRACTELALRRGRFDLFEDCGLGKGPQLLEWCRVVREKTNQNVLIAAPLAVAQQLLREAKKFDIEDINYRRQQCDVTPGITITNYEMIEHFDPSQFIGFAGDEISIIKNFTGKTRNLICDMFSRTPYKLGATATPAPNDFVELGNQVEFLGIMSRTEMLATYFIHDGGETSKWRLKGHAEDDFWKWVCTWSVCIRRPSDIGFSDEGYNLPPLNIHEHMLNVNEPTPGFLIPMPARTLKDQREVKRATQNQRVDACARIVNKSKEPWIVVGELNDECDELEHSILGAVQVAGSDSIEAKEERLIGFTDGKYDRMVSKSSIIGYGMNWQHCHNIGVVNITHSAEDMYQLIRRCYRFGQKSPVNVHLFFSEAELPILHNVQRKQKEADEMSVQMLAHMKDAMKAQLGKASNEADEYKPTKKMKLPAWVKA